MSAIQRALDTNYGPAAKPCQGLFWSAGLFCAVVAVAMLAILTGPRMSGPARAEQTYSGVQVTEVKSVLAGRTDCSEIGISDLHSPAEGLWFQTNCSANVSPEFSQVSTNCNRTSLDDSFTPVAPGLFVSRLNSGSLGFLWFSPAESCFDLVSSKVVTFVCADQTVSFKWGGGACSGHGGVLALVNGR